LWVKLFIRISAIAADCLKNCFGKARHLTAEELALFQG
jgi:hypothetical protein